MQATLKAPVTFDGVGLHSGNPVRLTVRPASAEHGIWFRRVDLSFGDALVPALWSAVERAPLCTRIKNASGVTVSTIEHLMAALAGCGITNALIDLDGPEVPILDGSAAPFVRGFLARGIFRQDAPMRAIKILKAVQVEQGEAVARLEPAEGFAMDFDIDFEDAAIGHQAKTLDLANGAFVHELSDSRTFCSNADVRAMHANGLALGGTLKNAVVFEGAQILSPGGLRHGDEPVRHKMLDAVGDLALAGAPIIGRYVGHRAGHALTNILLHAVFARPECFRMVECDVDMVARLPGAGLTRADAVALHA
ncbi:MAG: UDP-3-O-acyl-N-acetylglucosamine deacetylase [Pseudomonadota bacterium]